MSLDDYYSKATPMKHLLIEDAGSVRILTINRPQHRNALCSELVDQLRHAIDVAGTTSFVRVVIITGQGEKAFVAGADIGELYNASPARAEQASRTATDLYARIRQCTKPVIAAINGHCLGGGLELALACDIRIATASAVFGLPEVKLGILPGGGGTVHLRRLVGDSAARALCLTGSTIDAIRAYGLGLVTEVVFPPTELMVAALRLANELAALSTTAVVRMKQTLNLTETCEALSGEAIERTAFALCFTSPDQQEGMKAFMERREPQFK